MTAPMYDLLIRNAFIVDGSGAPGYGGDLTVLGERIAEIGSLQNTQAHRTIDADGLVACPGFVDIHSHSDYHLLVEPLARSSLHQGVTLEIGGNCGYSSAPIWGEA
ncbi:MAG: amidohydrolase family protein, partial [Deltaproteobacteria bacterium]|nr:amidohydrolase family protein [Deltaproteobacteria bacterium]